MLPLESEDMHMDMHKHAAMGKRHACGRTCSIDSRLSEVMSEL